MRYNNGQVEHGEAPPLHANLIVAASACSRQCSTNVPSRPNYWAIQASQARSILYLTACGLVEEKKYVDTVRTARDKAQGLVEYGLIIALVAVVAVAGLIIFGPAVSNLLKSVGASV